MEAARRNGKDGRHCQAATRGGTAGTGTTGKGFDDRARDQTGPGDATRAHQEQADTGATGKAGETTKPPAEGSPGAQTLRGGEGVNSNPRRRLEAGGRPGAPRRSRSRAG